MQVNVQPREFSYGGTLIPRGFFWLGSACLLLLAAAGAWLTIYGITQSARTQGAVAFGVFLAVFVFGCFAPLFVRWALIVRVDDWGVWLPARARREKRNGLSWEQIADVRLVAGAKRNAVVLVPHNPATLSPLMKRFGVFVLPVVNITPERLKDVIDEYRASVEKS